MIDNYITLTDLQAEKLDLFYNLHLNATFNLTSIKDREQFYIKHLLDSIFFFKKHSPSFNTLCDIGSGGGFPGVVIAIFYPDAEIFLCESIRKKAEFLKFAARELSLDNIIVLNNRIEDLKTYKFDFFTARGVAKLLDILKKSWNVSHETSSWLMYKGENLPEELKVADQFIKKHYLEVEYERIEDPFCRSYCFIRRCG
ncbi:16S rRNA (guanine(527)-N(7))-methyltransferase RsmG [Calditerrivibrio sp.]|jgi:16S rRNA (guanine527-N7)-methyltransferase|uniref:16S rRNA (guanine(527)-N(7))-methyltransferase RsmG n=1 Tax=Calditerrivibrio sp. TaxID=2792612 RepID=UPI003D14226A